MTLILVTRQVARAIRDAYAAGHEYPEPGQSRKESAMTAARQQVRRLGADLDDDVILGLVHMEETPHMSTKHIPGGIELGIL